MENNNQFNYQNTQPELPVYGTIHAARPVNPQGAQGSLSYSVPGSGASQKHPVRTFFIILLLLMFVASFFFNFLLLGIGFFDLSSMQHSSVQEQTYAGSWLDSNKIAIINIEGTIMDGEDYRDQIVKAYEDDSVKAVVLRVNSPGGTITGSDYIYHQLTKLRDEKPLVVSMGSLAASGGYYVSMAVGHEEDVIYAEPTTWTGSIGVIISHYDASDLFQQKLGVKNDPIKSGTMKGMGSMMEPLSDAQRQVLQSLVDDSFDRFKDIVKSGRACFEKDQKALDDLATGQVYNTNQALELGLIDKVGFLDDAILRAMELADLESAHVVEYQTKETLMDALMAGQAKAMSNANPFADVKFFMDAATPRAYYLWTAR